MKRICLAIPLFIFLFGSSAWGTVVHTCKGDYNPSTWDDCRGIHVSENGEKYDGEFRDGVRQGRGTLIFPDGRKWVGYFRNGKLNGSAIKYSAEGTVEKEGIFKDDEYFASDIPYNFQKGGSLYEVKAIFSGLADLVFFDCENQSTVYNFFASDEGTPCRKTIFCSIPFEAASVDLNGDGLDEVFVDYESRGFCGSGGCTKYIIEKKKDKSNWEVIWQGFGGRELSISSNKTNGYSDIYFGANKCTYEGIYKCLDPY